MLKKVFLFTDAKRFLDCFSAPLPCVRAKEAPKSVPLEAPFSYEGALWRLDAENALGLPRNYRTCDDAYRAIPPRYAKEASSHSQLQDYLSSISQDPASTLKKDSMQSLQIFEIEPKDLLSLLTCDRRASGFSEWNACKLVWEMNWLAGERTLHRLY